MSDLPTLVIEVLRHPQSMTYRFFKLVPEGSEDTEMIWDMVGAGIVYYHQPFRKPWDGINLEERRDPTSPKYAEVGRKQIGEEKAEETRLDLIKQGYQMLTYDLLPRRVAHWITHSHCPIEYHTELDARDPELMDRVKLWVKGDLLEGSWTTHQ